MPDGDHSLGAPVCPAGGLQQQLILRGARSRTRDAKLQQRRIEEGSNMKQLAIRCLVAVAASGLLSIALMACSSPSDMTL